MSRIRNDFPIPGGPSMKALAPPDFRRPLTPEINSRSESSTACRSVAAGRRSFSVAAIATA